VIRRVLVLLALAASVAACSSSGHSHEHSATPSDLSAAGSGVFQGFGLDPAQPRPQFTLKDTSGATFEFGTKTAKAPTLLFFGYTHCPDECPTTMADVASALRAVPASVAKSAYVVFVTTDVKRDTGPVIEKWLSRFSKNSKARWVGLNGTQAQINAAQAAAHVTIAEDGGETHSTQVLLYGPDDYAHVSYLLNSKERDQMVHDLPLVAAGRS
jgi:protein SCO1/2